MSRFPRVSGTDRAGRQTVSTCRAAWQAPRRGRVRGSSHREPVRLRFELRRRRVRSSKLRFRPRRFLLPARRLGHQRRSGSVEWVGAGRVERAGGIARAERGGRPGVSRLRDLAGRVEQVGRVEHSVAGSGRVALEESPIRAALRNGTATREAELFFVAGVGKEPQDCPLFERAAENHPGPAGGHEEATAAPGGVAASHLSAQEPDSWKAAEGFRTPSHCITRDCSYT